MTSKNDVYRDTLISLVGPEHCPTCLNHLTSVSHRELCLTDNTPPKKEKA